MTGRSTSSSRIDDGKDGRAAMNCQDFEPFLFAYVDGEFDGPERSDADAHLAACEACRREVEQQRAYKRRMREVAATPCALNPPAPAVLREHLCDALAAEPAARRLAFLRPRILVPFGLAAAAAVAMFVWASGTSPAQADALIREAINHHQGNLPLDVQDEHVQQVRDWMRGRLDFAPSRIPELRNVAMRGARLSSLNGHPAAYVVYSPRPAAGAVAGAPARRVSLLVFDAPELRLPAGRRSSGSWSTR